MDLRERTKELTELEASYETTLPLLVLDTPRAVRVAFVSSKYFALLGVAGHGAGFGGLPWPANVAVISRSLRNTLKQEDGTSHLLLAGQPLEIGGVVDGPFRGTRLQPVELWLPLEAVTSFGFDEGVQYNRGARWLRLVGRLRKGSSLDEAEREIKGILTESGEDTQGVGTVVKVQRLSLAGDEDTPVLIRLTALLEVGGLLMLCTSVIGVAGLGACAGIRLQRDTVVMAAVGAPRSALLLRSISEQGILCALAGVALVATYTLNRGRPFLVGSVLDVDATEGVPKLIVLSIVAFVTACSSLPRFFQDITAVAAARKIASGAGATRQLGWLQSVGTGSVAGLATALCTVGFLFTASTTGLAKVEPGFQPEGLYEINFPEGYKASAEQRSHSLALARDAVAASSGIEGASLSSAGSMSSRNIVLATTGKGHLSTPVELWIVDSSFFRVIGAVPLSGRLLDAKDDASRERVALADPLLAQKFGGKDPGKCVRFGGAASAPCRRLVGIVPSVLIRGPLELRLPQVFLQRSQASAGHAEALFFRANNERAAIAALHRARAARPELRYLSMASATTAWQRVLRPLQQISTISLALAFLMAVQSGMLTFAMASLTAELRRKELAVRAALGCPRGLLLRAVTGLPLLACVLGVTSGIVVAAALDDFLLLQLNVSAPTHFGAVWIAGAVPTLVAVLFGLLLSSRVALVSNLNEVLQSIR